MATSFKLEDIFSVKGKTVVITGGGSGLGKAIAAGFVTNGSTVYITGRREEVLQSAASELNKDNDAESSGGKAIPIKGDVGTKAGCLAIAHQLEKSGVTKVDTLVNCAGVSKPWRNPTSEHDNADAVAKMMAEVEDEDFNYSNEINSNGVYFMTVALLPLLRKAEAPNVTVIASIAGLANQRTMGSLSYGVSKAATIHCAELLAGRFHPMRIRVNTICPGIFPSEMTGVNSNSEREGHRYDMGEAANKAAARSTADNLRMEAEHNTVQHYTKTFPTIPLLPYPIAQDKTTIHHQAILGNNIAEATGRPGRPVEIVGPVLLLSSKAGGYMNNALLTVDGGRLMGAGINDGIRMPEDTYI